MFKKFLMISIAAMALSAVPAIASVSDCPEGNPPAEAPRQGGSKDDFKQWMKQMKKYKHDFLARELKLTAEQRESFFALYDKMEDEKWQLGRDVRRMERDVNKKGDEATDLELEKAADAAMELSGKQYEVERRYYQEFKKVLTKRQLFKLSGAERKFQKSLIDHRGKHKNKD